MHDDRTSIFGQLLKLDRSCTIHQTNIETLAIEILKTKINSGPQFMNDIFVAKNDNGFSLRNMNLNLRMQEQSVTERIH